MRHRVAFQSRTTVADGAGGRSVSWSTTATVWAKVSPLRGTEAIVAGKVSSPATHKVTIRAGSVAVDHSMRMVFNGQNYNVRSALERDERNRFVDVLVERDTPT